MSRIGKNPVEVTADINVSVNGNVITFAKGKNSVDLDTKGNVGFVVDGDNSLFVGFFEIFIDQIDVTFV